MVIARMDTPQYGETLKFVYIKYQPILVIELVNFFLKSLKKELTGVNSKLQWIYKGLLLEWMLQSMVRHFMTHKQV